MQNKSDKPKFISGKKVDKDSYEAVPICPACRSVLIKGQNCKRCFQNIDWSDE